MQRQDPALTRKAPVVSDTVLACLLDWDGVLLDSQPAKNGSWTLPALYFLGKVDRNIIDRLKDPTQAKRAAAEAMALLNQHFELEFRTVAAVAGLSQDDTLQAVWRLLMADYRGQATQEDLRDLRNAIRDPLILYCSAVLGGTVVFIRAAHGTLPLGLVTQAKRKDVYRQADALGIPIELFDAIECAGDYEPVEGVDAKRVAYANACRRLGRSPIAAIAVEDADGGLRSAKAAGLRCIGLRAPGNRQALRLADLVVPDLGLLAPPEIIEILKGPDVDDVFRRLREPAAAVTVANIVGGRNLSTAEVRAGGEMVNPLDCAWTTAIEGDAMEGIPRLIARQVKRVAGSRRVRVVGVSLKGPLRVIDGNVWVGPWVVPPYDVAWPFDQRLRDALDEAGVAFGWTCVMLDSVAALRGEMHARGTLAGHTSGIALIWGTGIGITIWEKGKVVTEIGQDEPGDDFQRLRSSAGRCLVLTPTGYELRPIPLGHTRAPLGAGEQWMSERLGGAWLPRVRVARDLLRADDNTRARVLRDMDAPHINLQEYLDSDGQDDRIERTLMDGLTRAAARDNEWAREEIGSIGDEFGDALAAFVRAFQQHDAVEHVVIVSTIGERLGKNVGGPGIDEDVLMDRLRRSLEASLVRRGMDATKARTVARSVQRSKIGRERECLAFDPADANLPCA